MATISMTMGLRGWLPTYLSDLERQSGIVLPRPPAVVIGSSRVLGLARSGLRIMSYPRAQSVEPW